jgi:hypothetical protein
MVGRSTLFASHRRDLKEAHEQHVKALMKLVEMLAEQVDYLRAKLDGHPHIPASAPSANPSGLPAPQPGRPLFLSEEEEDLMALRINEYIDDQDLAELQSQLNLPSLEADE